MYFRVVSIYSIRGAAYECFKFSQNLLLKLSSRELKRPQSVEIILYILWGCSREKWLKLYRGITWTKEGYIYLTIGENRTPAYKRVKVLHWCWSDKTGLKEALGLYNACKGINTWNGISVHNRVSTLTFKGYSEVVKPIFLFLIEIMHA